MLSCLLIFAAVAALGTHAVPYCPPQLQREGQLRTFRNNCFSFHPEHEREFEEAENFCRQDGGHLAIIRDIETQNFLYHVMHDQLHYGGEVWIGMNDKNSEGTFVWNDGSRASFTYWASGQPNNFLGIGDNLEDCVFMDMSDRGRWHDNVCHEILLITHSKTFICEYPAIDLTTSTSTTTTTTLRPTSRQATTTTTQPPPRTTRAATSSATTATATTAKATKSATTTAEATAAASTTAKAQTAAATTAKTQTAAATTAKAQTAAATTAKAQTAAATTAKTQTAGATTAKATTAAATTRTVTSVRTEAQTTSTTTSAESVCPAFECSKDCGLSGYKFDGNGCLICQCDD